MSRSTEELINAINNLLRGHVDRKEEGEILELLEQADGRQLGDVLLGIDLSNLLSDVDDRWIGPDNRTRLLELLTVTRLSDLGLDARVRLVNALQKGKTGSQDEEAICRVVLRTRASDLTSLKNGVDSGEDYRDLQQLVFRDIDDATIRDRILDHIAREGAGRLLPAVKAISDIDDTFCANLKDDRYPKGTRYPGVLQYYEELVRGVEDSAEHRGNLVFLTARPTVRTGLIEQYTKHSLSQKGITGDFTVLSGDFRFGNDEIGQKKYENFVEYQ